MKALASKMIQLIETTVGGGYVYGMPAGECTIETIKQASKLWGPRGSYPTMGDGYYEINNDFSKGRCAKWIGKFSTDCSGLIKWARKRLGAGWADVSAQGTYEQCSKCGSISSMKLIPGTLVFVKGSKRIDHVGIYIGNGLVIEARGVAYGIVKTKLNERPWSHWGIADWMDMNLPQERGIVETISTGDAGDASSVKIGDTSEPILGQLKVITDALNIRSAPNTNSNILGVLKSGETWNVFEVFDDWYRIGKKNWVSSKYVEYKPSMRWNKPSNTVMDDLEFIRVCDKIKETNRFSDVQSIVDGIYSSKHLYKDAWLRAEAK